MTREKVRPTSGAINDTDFPFLALTICPLYSAAYDDDVVKEYGLDKYQYRAKGNYTPTSSKNNETNLRKVFNDITYELEEVLKRVTFFTLDSSVFNVDFNAQTNDHSEIIKVTTKYWNNYGRCYVIRPSDTIVKLGVRSVDFVARMGIYIFFGYPGQFMYNTKTKVLTKINML